MADSEGLTAELPRYGHPIIPNINHANIPQAQ